MISTRAGETELCFGLVLAGVNIVVGSDGSKAGYGFGGGGVESVDDSGGPFDGEVEVLGDAGGAEDLNCTDESNVPFFADFSLSDLC